MIALPPQGGTTESGLRIAEKKDPLKKRVVFLPSVRCFYATAKKISAVLGGYGAMLYGRIRE
jgi:hypothetical protein